MAPAAADPEEDKVAEDKVAAVATLPRKRVVRRVEDRVAVLAQEVVLAAGALAVGDLNQKEARRRVNKVAMRLRRLRQQGKLHPGKALLLNNRQQPLGKRLGKQDVVQAAVVAVAVLEEAVAVDLAAVAHGLRYQGPIASS